MRQPKIITTMQEYSWTLFRGDVLAGLTVALVALPLSIAIAIASGATPADGLITAIIGGFFISLLGGSRVQIGGPTGAFIVVVYGVIADHGYDGLVLATLMAGVMLLIAGYFRLGRYIKYVPESVIEGFTIGIAIIIAMSELSDALGLNVPHMPAEFFGKVEALWHARGTLALQALGITALTLLVIVALKKYAPRLPGLIIAVTMASAAALLAGLPIDTIAGRYGTLPSTLPVPHMPEISWPLLWTLLPSALTIAFLAGIESLLSAVVADRMMAGNHRPNAELLAQGAGNMASALCGGLPVTGAIARTATNVKAGGKTPVAGIVHALAILVIMMVLAETASLMAMPALAALLLYTAWNMSEPHKWKHYASLPKKELFVLVLTLLLTVTVDLTIAIAVGVALGLILRLKRSA
jgi:SulP family sulfate permease